nr:atherin-like [Aegilops tauschii subsp. strangulata]
MAMVVVSPFVHSPSPPRAAQFRPVVAATATAPDPSCLATPLPKRGLPAPTVCRVASLLAAAAAARCSALPATAAPARRHCPTFPCAPATVPHRDRHVQPRPQPRPPLASAPLPPQLAPYGRSLPPLARPRATRCCRCCYSAANCCGLPLLDLLAASQTAPKPVRVAPRRRRPQPNSPPPPAARRDCVLRPRVALLPALQPR